MRVALALITIGMLIALPGLLLVATQSVRAEIALDEPGSTSVGNSTTKVSFNKDLQGTAESSTQRIQDLEGQGTRVRVSDLRFAHLTTNDGLSQSNVTAILQDRQGFMWFATRDGLNRYDGNSFVVYKHNPNDPGSLSANYLQDLMEDDQGYLWIATLTGGVNKFDPRTERFTRYRHDPGNSNSISGDSVYSIAH